MSAVRLFAIDLDGTLLDSQQRLSPANRQALEQALQSGATLALASARDCASIRIKAPLEHAHLYYLSSGGALIYHTASRTIAWQRSLSGQLAAECVAFLQTYGYPVFLNSGDDYWVDRMNERVSMIETRYNLTTRFFRSVVEVIQPLHRVSLAAPAALLETAARQAEAVLGKRICVSLASPDWLDLLAPEAGKGRALAALQDLLDVSPDQTASIGDYECDLTLFERAAYRVAMGNATSPVKAAATCITADNNHDGVAQAINQLSALAS